MSEGNRAWVVAAGVAGGALILMLGVVLFGGGADDGEVERVVEQIRASELAYHAKFDEWVPTDWSPRPRFEVNGEEVPWVAEEGFVKLGFAGEDDAFVGTYRVTVDRSGFTVTGVCDLDGDGHQRVVVATATQAATVVSGEER